MFKNVGSINAEKKVERIFWSYHEKRQIFSTSVNQARQVRGKEPDRKTQNILAENFQKVV